MTIEQDIFRFHRKLTDKRIAKHFHYKLVYSNQSIIIIIGCVILYISSMCIVFRSEFPILEEFKILIMWMAILDSIIVLIMLFITDKFHIHINQQNKKVNLDSIRQKAIYLYLIKQKYISRNKDNSCFYSALSQSTQFNFTMYHNTSFLNFFSFIMGIGFPILSFILDENANIRIKIAWITIAVSTCAFIAFLFHFLRLKECNRSSRYKKLHSIILSIQLKKSIKRKI